MSNIQIVIGWKYALPEWEEEPTTPLNKEIGALSLQTVPEQAR